jgi:hypothetical protein
MQAYTWPPATWKDSGGGLIGELLSAGWGLIRVLVVLPKKYTLLSSPPETGLQS